MSQKWHGWQYAICEFEASGSFNYAGPDTSLVKRIEAKFKFFQPDYDEEIPVLQGKSEAPSWMRCLEHWPIFTNPLDIEIHFPESICSLWQRAVGKLVRLDSSRQPGSTSGFFLDFALAENGRTARLPGCGDLEPGIYEIRIRGPIGVEDLLVPFIYLPFDQYERIWDQDDPNLASHFCVSFDRPVDMEATEKTALEINENELKISIQEDHGEAFCALRFFTNSRYPLTLLLARSQVRWSRRTGSGVFEWSEWKAKMEEIPIQRLEELQDVRVLVETDREIFQSPGDKRRKLTFLLKDSVGKSSVLMSYEASRKRGCHNLWVLDLRQFSDQLKSISDAQYADIVVSLGEERRELALFTLLRYPEFKDFTISSLGVNSKSERLRITWTPGSNDPATNRFLSCYPIKQPERTVSSRLEDSTPPPVEVEIERPKEAGVWTGQIEIRHSRFGRHKIALGEGVQNQDKWFRAPPGWIDWLEWPDIRNVEISEMMGTLYNLPKKIVYSSFPWLFFLEIFHHGWGDDSFRVLRSILGEETIKKAAPFSQGSTWEAKSRSGKNLRMEVISAPNTLEGVFRGKPPSQWFQIPEGIEIDLCMAQNHVDLGKAGCIWRCNRSSRDHEAVMKSEELGRELDLNIWLEDAIYPEEKGFLSVRMPLETLWFNPPLLPILNKVYQEDVIFFDISPYFDERDTKRPFESGYIQKSDLKTTFADIIEAQDKRKFTTVTPEEKKQARSLVKEWNRWTQRSEVNRLLASIVKKRLDYSAIHVLTGATSFIVRLRAHGYENTVMKYPFSQSRDKKLERLLEESLEFVHSYLPKAFLRDLILSEVLVCWYWDKTLVSL